MKIYNKVEQIDTIKWNELLEKSNTASFFQSRVCYDFYKSLSFLEPFIFAVSEDDTLVGLICGYLISDGNKFKKFFSRRAIVPGGALFAQTISDEALTGLLQEMQNNLSKKSIYLEIRNYNDYSNYRRVFESVDYNYVPHLNFHITTPNLESAFMKFNTTKRRDVRLSLKTGAEISEVSNNEELISLYELLKHLYKTRVKTPLFPFEFFEKLLQCSESKLFIIKYQEKVIGGSVCVLLPNNILYEWFVCGLDGHFKNVFPSTLATYAAIEYAAKNNISRFDMMGAGKPEEGYGVREFKSKFGGELVEHGRFLYVCQPLLYSIGKYIIKRIKSRK